MTEYIYEHKPSGADHMGKPVELPTLVQREEIVRCKDCHFSLAHGNGCGRNQDIYEVEPDGFCAWACRKSE